MRIIRTISIVVMAISMISCSTLASGWEKETLKMVMIPAAEATEELARYNEIAEFLEKKIDRPIEMVVATDYSVAITSLKVGDAQMARLSPFSYVLATTQVKVEPIVRGVKKSTGKDAYYGYIIAKADSGIESLEDVKGRTFAFVDPGSTSGYLLPMAMFDKAGIDPDKDFARTYFAGTHPAVIAVVKAGKVDAGAIADNRYEDALRAGVIKPGELVVIAKTGMVPTSPIVVRSDMDEELKKRLQDAWLAIPSDLTEKAVGQLTHYVKAVDSDYDYLREVAKILELDLTKMK